MNHLTKAELARPSEAREDRLMTMTPDQERTHAVWMNIYNKAADAGNADGMQRALDNMARLEEEASNAAALARMWERERSDREARLDAGTSTSGLAIAGCLVACVVAWACVAYLLAVAMGVL